MNTDQWRLSALGNRIITHGVSVMSTDQWRLSVDEVKYHALNYLNWQVTQVSISTDAHCLQNNQWWAVTSNAIRGIARLQAGCFLLCFVRISLDIRRVMSNTPSRYFYFAKQNGFLKHGNYLKIIIAIFFKYNCRCVMFQLRSSAWMIFSCAHSNASLTSIHCYPSLPANWIVAFGKK